MERVEKAVRYRNVMEELYRMFQDNHIVWEIVNTGYMDKLYDIYADRQDIHQETNAACSIRIDYGEYQETVREDRLLKKLEARKA